MRLKFGIVCLLSLIYNINAACTDIEHCDSCSNPPLQCYTCSPQQVLKVDQTGCLDCPSDCAECIADAEDEVQCTKCYKGFLLDKDGSCVDCGKGCEQCHYDEEENLVCDVCAVHYVMDTSVPTQDCIECPTNCKTCSLKDGATVCSACYNREEHGSKAYYLKSSDKTCKACPTNCAECSDNGEGVGICKSCISGYNLLEDPDDSTKDGTKCLKCPTDCASCSGIDNSGEATCTSCKADKGLYVDNGECALCESAACKNCDEEGTCIECKEEYRLDNGACVACPAFCLSCEVDEDGNDVCSNCESGFGEKDADSITCDACPSKCSACSLSNDGTITCTTCETGYAKNGDGKCVACASGCQACQWQSTYMQCSTCKSGYTDSPILPDPLSAESANNVGVCKACIAHCTSCPDEDNCNPSSCEAGYVNISSNANSVCAAVTPNCATAADDGTIDCSVCDDEYYENSGECDECPSGKNCKTCDSTDCITCFQGYAFVDADMDNVTDSCESCGISQCLRCHAIGDYAGYEKKCFECNTGYALYDTDGSTSNGYESCKKCPSGCDSCTVDTNDNDKTKCDNNGCWSYADHQKAYTNGDDGACVACPQHCKQCTYDSSEEATTCDDNQCVAGYAKDPNSGECEKCPENCLTCEWDDSSSSIICSSAGCDVGYGLNQEKLCDPCPGNCDACEFDETLEVLLCVDCADGYRSNDEVCASCPANCDSCNDQSGTMICDKCNEGYALKSSDKSCVKCPTNCLECEVKGTSVHCKSCKVGYAIAADKLSCLACSEAAFDNCAVCEDFEADAEQAECVSCKSGYALKDDASECLDASSFDCGYDDRAAECSACSTSYVATPDKEVCTQYCYVCGDIDSNVWVPQSSCNVGTNTSVLEQCDTGACWGKYKSVNGEAMVMAGCLEEQCSGDYSNGETCDSTEEVDICSQCCTGNKCNSFADELDGVPDSGIIPTVSLLLLLASLLQRYL